MCVCVCVYIYIYTHTCIYTHIYTYTHTYICTYIHPYSVTRQVLEEVSPSHRQQIKTFGHPVRMDIQVSVRKEGQDLNIPQHNENQDSQITVFNYLPVIKVITSTCSASILFGNGFISNAEKMLFSDPVGFLFQGPRPVLPLPRDRPGRPQSAGSVSHRVVFYTIPVRGPSAIDHLLMFSDLLN